ncbi:unnamed protein product [Owenia fusiformis]|uniref:Cation/H+ exchanger transmembrane domain-containing protein n=1 Tax=Owenia fusiformis TaxID=6347 RepID=A0A8J1UAT0_OWEFU|nr:unnamed protein product [Owenia fusiformis]
MRRKSRNLVDVGFLKMSSRILTCMSIGSVIYIGIVVIWSGTETVQADIGHHIVKVHQLNIQKRQAEPAPVKPPVPKPVQTHYEWKKNSFQKLGTLLRRKKFAIERLVEYVKRTSANKNIPIDERHYQADVFNTFMKELNESEVLIFTSMDWLDNALKGNYRDFLNIKQSSKQRLEALRDATLKEEQEYNALLNAEKQKADIQERLKHLNSSTKIEGVIDDILNQVAKAADQLEHDLDDHIFDNAVKEQANKAQGNNIEAVIRLHDRDTDQANEQANKSDDQGMEVMKLVDSRDNQFVLSKGKDSTVPHEDHHLIQDVIYLMLLSFLFGWLCTALHFPTMFGYVLSGIILGPSGFNTLKSLVQLETLGEFGVFFILFSVGLEFSPDQLKKVLKVATLGSASIMGIMVAFGVLLGNIVYASHSESAFIAACLSLSSTPLVVRFLSSNKEREMSQGTDYGTVLLGILIMQDVLLGLLIALLPTLAQHGTSSEGPLLQFMILFAQLGGALCVTVMLAWLLAQYAVGPFYRYLVKKDSNELTMLATISIAFLMLTITNFLHISMELGCFIAGILVSAQGHHLAEHIDSLIQPIKNFLGSIFFASIGLHVFPSFLAYEVTILTTLTMAVVGFKFFTSVFVLGLLLPKSAKHYKWIVAAGLAQVSEFSFVLGSRARQLGLISREIYLLILSVTTLSLILAPVLWRMSLWQLRSRRPKRQRAGHTSPSPVTASFNANTDLHSDRPDHAMTHHIKSRTHQVENWVDAEEDEFILVDFSDQESETEHVHGISQKPV